MENGTKFTQEMVPVSKSQSNCYSKKIKQKIKIFQQPPTLLPDVHINMRRLFRVHREPEFYPYFTTK